MDGHQTLLLIAICLVLSSLSTTFGNLKPAAANIIENAGGLRRKLATENPGFISIDCGVDEDYLDEKTEIFYKSDTNFISTGHNGDIDLEYDYINANFARQVKNLRFFPYGQKNCYTLQPEQGKYHNYLIRVFFKYGNYDGKNQVPKFDLYLGVQYWATVQLADSTVWSYYDAVHFSLSDFIFVCLVNTGSGIPFISSLELRSLNNSIYGIDSGFATVHRRYDLGNPNITYARYKDDAYDRIWSSYIFPDSVSLNTTSSIEVQDDSYRIPNEVLRTAVQPGGGLRSLNFSVNYTYASRNFHVYFYFTEVQRIAHGSNREFTITMNSIIYGPITPEYLKPLTIRSENAIVQGVIQFSINPTEQSDLPPILNAFEILMDSPSNVSATFPGDVEAITAIMRIYKIKRLDWQGDPCVPRDFSWNGLNCSNYNNTPRITSLNFGSSKLTGKIASALSNLTALQSLDLSYNELTGSVPEFLAQLPNLTVLNLTGNKLTGPLPLSLTEKIQNGTLLLSFDETPNPCTADSCKRKKPNFILLVLVSIIAILVILLLGVIAIFSRMKRRVIVSRNESSLRSKNQPFTYSEIVDMTNNFSNIIGGGGFGQVYLGNLSDSTQVAVKLLSQSSKQGFKEFQSEVQLLIMVYHRNLVSLIGYCNDHGNMALVYEYMENGNLRQHLSDTSMNVLSWRERLQIAVDAAHGLEYLHNGCKPAIIHRDLKTSNILLNENFLAKISDFGLSRAFATENDTHVTTNPAGTFGYVDPEFYRSGNLNKKSDVYSFGIILFELITGKPVVIRGEESSTHILQWVSTLIERGDIQRIVDARLEGEFNTNSAWKAVEIAMSCVPSTAIQRPDMSHVLSELKECLAMEMTAGNAQRMRSNRTRSTNSFQMGYLDFDTEISPTAR